MFRKKKPEKTKGKYNLVIPAVPSSKRMSFDGSGPINLAEDLAEGNVKMVNSINQSVDLQREDPESQEASRSSFLEAELLPFR